MATKSITVPVTTTIAPYTLSNNDGIRLVATVDVTCSGEYAPHAKTVMTQIAFDLAEHAGWHNIPAYSLECRPGVCRALLYLSGEWDADSLDSLVGGMADLGKVKVR